MKKILVVCGNGLGSSFIVEMNVKTVLGQLGIEAEVSHTDLTTGKSEKADIYLGSKDLISQLDDGTRTIIGLTNILDLNELKSVLEAHLL
ncbi:PTS sugar transporter subunit IIB [Bacillus sp. 1NLA3E]|uniref:PTS sugar transporter subunit IIB n=1 Tax=Bacillus sp. 1NLA3E TaxID=666686 RepID=UPI000247EB82|nr:PTS sugar transporter subunit IIB [Bacillus sp. 1NLA3E]AGK55767.1 PTS system lactose/cellobiose specific iib subunit [Bacillus sp. 1NLA3E]